MRLPSRVLLAFVLLVPAAVHGQAVRPKPAAGPAADFVAPGPLVPLPPPVAAAVDAVRADALAAHIEFLAAPSLEGRGLGRQGLEAAAEYVVTSLAVAGIRPLAAAPATRAAYFQPVPVREVTNARGQVTVENEVEGLRQSRTFLSAVDCVFPDIAPQVFSGPVVFAGYGIREPSAERDDYHGLDVRGKIVVVIGGLPDGAEWQKPEWVARYGAARGPRRYTAKLATAASLGARAVLALESAEFAAALAGSVAAPVPYFLPADEVPPSDPLTCRGHARGGARAASRVRRRR